MKKQDGKKSLVKRIWQFIWDDDSIWSWVVNVILAFVLIKFILYPGIGLLLGTTHPVVAVVSGSMEHKAVGGMICGVTPSEYKGDFNSFWETCGGFYSQFNITKESFQKFYLKNGFNTGDIIVLLGKKPKDIYVGDVIVFQENQPDPIIHRVVKKWQENEVYFYATKGDHNPGQLNDPRYIDETRIPQNKIIGKAVFRIPFLGYIKIWFVQLLQLLGLSNSVGRLF